MPVLPARLCAGVAILALGNLARTEAARKIGTESNPSRSCGFELDRDSDRSVFVCETPESPALTLREDGAEGMRSEWKGSLLSSMLGVEECDSGVISDPASHRLLRPSRPRASAVSSASFVAGSGEWSDWRWRS